MMMKMMIIMGSGKGEKWTRKEESKLADTVVLCYMGMESRLAVLPERGRFALFGECVRRKEEVLRRDGL